MVNTHIVINLPRKYALSNRLLLIKYLNIESYLFDVNLSKVYILLRVRFDKFTPLCVIIIFIYVIFFNFCKKMSKYERINNKYKILNSPSGLIMI